MTKPNKFLLDEEWLRDQYLVQMKSATKIASELGCQQETVSKYLHKYNIPIRTQSEEIGGERHPLYGKHHTEESKKKNSDSHIGVKLSEECKRKISIATSGKNNPRYGVTISNDQKQRQSASLTRFYEEHPESLIALSEKRKQYYIDHPDAALEMSNRKKEYYKEHPEVLIRAAEKRVQYYIDHPLSEEEKQKRAEPVIAYFQDHPEARKEHSKLMKVCNPSTRPDVAAKISESLKLWHAEHPQPEKSFWSIGGYFKKSPSESVWLRSTYETRYAHILKRSNIEWFYETKAFHISTLDTTYRPDFYLPEFNLWVEIKGYLSEVDKIKLTEFSKLYPKEILLMVYGKHIEQLENCGTSFNICDFGIFLTEQVLIWENERG